MPFRSNDAMLIRQFRQFLLHTDVRLQVIPQDVLEEAARLRAVVPGLKTPDALHAATALFVTNDAGFRRIPNLPFVLLDDVLAAS